MKNKCPVCNEKVECACTCIRADSECKNGHQWHTCTVHKVKVLGFSDHTLSTKICTCCETV